MSQPFDTCKTMMQKRFTTGYGQKVTPKLMWELISRNPSLVYTGFAARCFAGCIAVSVGELTVLALTKFAENWNWVIGHSLNKQLILFVFSNVVAQ